MQMFFTKPNNKCKKTCRILKTTIKLTQNLPKQHCFEKTNILIFSHFSDEMPISTIFCFATYMPD